MRLAALLPPFNGAGSFEQYNGADPTQVNCWTDNFAGTYSFNVRSGGSSALVHSSQYNLTLVLSGGASGDIQREYKADVPARRFTDITTHSVLIAAWACSSLGHAEMRFEFGSAINSINSFGSMQLKLLTGDVASDWLLKIAAVDDTGNRNAFVDDVNFGVDAVTLVPDWQWQTRDLQMREEQSTLAYRRWNTGFGTSRAYEVPLRYVPSSVADLLNWWHGQQFTLILEVNSEEGDVHLVRLVNPDSPLQQLQPPYGGLFQGTLQLQLVTTRGFE